MTQCGLTINLLLSSRRQPNLSSHASIFGKRIPLVPPGTRVVIHKSIDQRDTWVPRGVVGWYIGPITEHY